MRSTQRTLDKLAAWANRLYMDSSVNKCGVMHIGKRNLVPVPHEWVKSVDEERDLGVLMSEDLKSSEQSLFAKNKANLMLSIIDRSYSMLDLI